MRRPPITVKVRDDGQGHWLWYVLLRGKRLGVTVTEPPEQDDEDIVSWVVRR